MLWIGSLTQFRVYYNTTLDELPEIQMFGVGKEIDSCATMCAAVSSRKEQIRRLEARRVMFFEMEYLGD